MANLAIHMLVHPIADDVDSVLEKREGIGEAMKQWPELLYYEEIDLAVGVKEPWPAHIAAYAKHLAEGHKYVAYIDADDIIDYRELLYYTRWLATMEVDLAAVVEAERAINWGEGVVAYPGAGQFPWRAGLHCLVAIRKVPKLAKERANGEEIVGRLGTLPERDARIGIYAGKRPVYTWLRRPGSVSRRGVRAVAPFERAIQLTLGIPGLEIFYKYYGRPVRKIAPAPSGSGRYWDFIE